jgi:peptidoglycan/LPS O-acetylase OafA/YrhL
MKINYYPGLDGMRAVAALMVIFFHLMPISVLNLGWIGVDFFFVISGFLITSILINQRDHKSYFKLFYVRRSLRIFPLYFAVVIPFILLNVIIDDTSFRVAFPYIIYIQNITAIKDGYLLGLGHTWSLAIEEQYYLLYPALIYFTPQKKLIPVLLILIVLVIIIRFTVAFNGYHIYTQSTLLFTRADSMLIGGLLPVLFECQKYDLPKMKSNLNYLLLIGISFFFVFAVWQISTFGLSSYFVDLGNNNLKGNAIGQFKYTILAIIFASFIGKVAYGTSSLAIRFQHLFEGKGIKYLGKISYGLYLYHFPIHIGYDLVLTKFGIIQPVIVVVLLKVILTIIISAISWHYFERHVLKLKSKFAY